MYAVRAIAHSTLHTAGHRRVVVDRERIHPTPWYTMLCTSRNRVNSTVYSTKKHGTQHCTAHIAKNT
jgi:hypothetical protein